MIEEPSDFPAGPEKHSNSDAWSSSFERVVVQYEQFAAATAMRLEQLARERERGITPLVRALPMVAREEQLDAGLVVCVVCHGEHRTEPGPELMTPEGGTVCWACGRAGRPVLAAHVLADVADHVELAAVDVCESTTAFLLGLMRSRGNRQRADALQRTVARIQALLRDSQRHGQAEPAAWLQHAPGVDSLEWAS